MKFLDKYDSARPYAACYVVLRKGNKVAMLVRKNTGWRDGDYCLPAGKVEYKESYKNSAVREAKEEAGVDIDVEHLRFVHAMHRHSKQDGGYIEWVDIYFEASEWNGEPYNAEPHKADKLDWIDLENKPDNMVPETKAALNYIEQGVAYGEFGWNESSKHG